MQLDNGWLWDIFKSHATILVALSVAIYFIYGAIRRGRNGINKSLLLISLTVTGAEIWSLGLVLAKLVGYDTTTTGWLVARSLTLNLILVAILYFTYHIVTIDANADAD